LRFTTDRQAKDKQSGQKAKSQQGLFLSGKDIPARRLALGQVGSIFRP
jgi:hypothetical protein